MQTYSSNEEFFQALSNLIARIKQSGQSEAAKDIDAGYRALNGLTDGWAILMESMEGTLATHGKQLPADQASELSSMLLVVRKLVYR